MKHLAPQLDLPGTEAVFNLIGEIMEAAPVKESGGQSALAELAKENES